VLTLTTEIAALKAELKPKKTRDPAGKPLSPSERFKGDQAWKAVAPKAGEPHAQLVSRINFYWCLHHGFWTTHKPKDCTLGGAVMTASKPTLTLPAAATKKMTFAQAAAAIVDQGGGEDNI
jgi:hypothetical protein